MRHSTVDGRNPAPVDNYDNYYSGIDMDRPSTNWCRNSSIYSIAPLRLEDHAPEPDKICGEFLVLWIPWLKREITRWSQPAQNTVLCRRVRVCGTRFVKGVAIPWSNHFEATPWILGEWVLLPSLSETKISCPTLVNLADCAVSGEICLSCQASVWIMSPERSSIN